MSVTPVNQKFDDADDQDFIIGEPKKSTSSDLVSSKNQDDDETNFIIGQPGSFSTAEKPKVTATGAPKPKSPLTSAPALANQPPMSWQDSLSKASDKFLPDLKDQFYSIGQALIHPSDTLSAIGQIGSGIRYKLAKATGVQNVDDSSYNIMKQIAKFQKIPQDPNQQQRDEALVNHLINEYSTNFGSEEGFKRAIAEHPAGVLTDLSTLLGGVGGAAKAAGAVGDISSLAKAGQMASQAASMMDPIGVAIKTATGLPIYGARKLAEGTSGLNSYYQKKITEAASSNNPTIRDDFFKFYSGDGDPVEYIQRSDKAAQAMYADELKDFVNQRGALTGNPLFDPIFDAINQAKSQVNQYAGSKEFAKAREAIDAAQDLVNSRYFSSDPASKSMEGLNTLKQSIYDLKEDFNNPTAQRHLDSIYHGVKKSLTDANPKYADLMERYQDLKNGINDAKKLLAIGNKGGATQAMMKGIKAANSANGINVLERLAQYDPSIPYMLAGHAANPATAGWLRTALDLGAGITLGREIHPLAGVATAISGSPRAVGAINYAAGVPGRVLSPKGLYYSGAVGQEAAPDQKYVQPEQSDVANPEEEAEPGSFNSAFNWLINHEGEEYGIDSNGYGAKFGINQQAHPDVDVKNLSKDEAKQIYKNKYWDEINGDQLNKDDPKMALAGFDMAATAGPETAKRLLKESGGDINKFYALRQKYLNLISKEKITKGPASEDEVRNSWNRRGQEILNFSKGGRIERKSGGRVDNVQPLVDELMRKFKQAKKVTDKTTEPLLDQPDDAIVKALKVAQDAI